MRIALSIFLLLAVGCNMELAKSTDEPPEKKVQVITIEGAIVYYDETINLEWKTYEGSDLHDLHNDAVYMWKIDLWNHGIEQETKIDKAVITIDDITNTGNDGTDTLFINIFNVVTPPGSFGDHVVSMKDTFSTGNDNAFYVVPVQGDPHRSEATLIKVWHDEDGPETTTTLRIELTPEALEILNNYKSDNNWIGIGLDPDSGPVREPNRLYENNGAHVELTFFQ